MANLEEKRARLEALDRQRKKRTWIVLVCLGLFMVLGVTVVVVLSSQEAIPGFDNKYSIGKSMNYKDKKIEMTEVKPLIENGLVKLSLSDLKKNDLEYAMYDPNFNVGNNQKGLPIMAFITPAGRVMVTSSFCEPCYSRKFHIEGDELVCNICYTHWSLADLTGLNGGCTKYPPQQLNYTVDKSSDTIVIKEADLKAWHPRDYDASLTQTMTTSK